MRPWSWPFPEAPEALHAALVQHQHAALRDTLPVAHAIALLNLGMANYALWAAGVDPRAFGWTALLGLVAVVRLVQWLRWGARPVAFDDAERQLRVAQVLLLVVMSAASAFTTWVTATRLVGNQVLLPVALAFGALCLAQAMSAIPSAALASALLGIVPPALALLWRGDGGTRLIGVSALSVAVLQLSFLKKRHAALLELLQLQRRMSDLASFDALTGLLSRRALLEALQTRVEHGQPFALALVDLDGFKAINDTRGHAMGDALLRAVSQRFLACGEAVGRLGGDEFVVVLDGVHHDADCAARTAEILTAAEAPVAVGGATLQVSASVGYALYPADGTEVSALMRVADEAMYTAKRAGKNRAAGARET